MRLYQNQLYFSIVLVQTKSIPIDSNERVETKSKEKGKKSSITLSGKRNQIEHLFALKAKIEEEGGGWKRERVAF